MAAALRRSFAILHDCQNTGVLPPFSLSQVFASAVYKDPVRFVLTLATFVRPRAAFEVRVKSTPALGSQLGLQVFKWPDMRLMISSVFVLNPVMHIGHEAIDVACQ